MKKTFAAIGLSIALAAGSFAPTPVHAASRDHVAPALAGLGLIAVIAAASMADRERGGDGRRIEVRNAPQAPVWGHPVQKRKIKEHRGRAVRHRAAPDACVRDMRGHGSQRAVLSKKCLRRQGYVLR